MVFGMQELELNTGTETQSRSMFYSGIRESELRNRSSFYTGQEESSRRSRSTFYVATEKQNYYKTEQPFLLRMEDRNHIPDQCFIPFCFRDEV